MDRDEVTPGDLLKAARGEMTQAEVCRAGNLSASVVCDVEAGRRSVTPRILAAYESALGRDLVGVRWCCMRAAIRDAAMKWVGSERVDGGEA
jgi:transcriptional regulator with XRE-family HTH domain